MYLVEIYRPYNCPGVHVRILLSNDDGIYAPGLGILAKVLSEKHDVYVVAPDRQRSATGHSLTLHKPLRVQQVDLAEQVKGAWSTTGTPSDCVKLAIAQLLPEKPDLVISGVNAGPNLGSDVLYSGTVAAAMEAAFLDFPSIAVSAEKGEIRVYTRAAQFVLAFIEHYGSDFSWRSHRSFLNINVPAAGDSQVKGARMCELGLRIYNDSFEKRSDPMGRDYYWLSGHAVLEGEAPDSDVCAISEGFISLTPVTFNMTDKQVTERLSSSKRFNEFIQSL